MQLHLYNVVKYAMKANLLDCKCHYFPWGCRGLESGENHLVTIGLGGEVRVKANSDNVTKYEVFSKASLR